MTIFDGIALAGGIALFLYGMTIMGSGLEKLAGGKMESVLQKLTSSPLRGVALGALITGIIQSSAGTTVIVIGLVNSGILQLSQAIGVIMGANIGTTVTGQLIRLSDMTGTGLLVQLLKPTTFAPVVAFIGAILFVFFKAP
ncbi:MAG: Na/Pi symporter, partial [Ruthenibacterium sp.]